MHLNMTNYASYNRILNLIDTPILIKKDPFNSVLIEIYRQNSATFDWVKVT